MNTEPVLSNSPLYRPILRSSRDVRVIILHPLSKDSRRQNEIKCSLIRESLDRNPQFEALSYAWGESTSEKDIILNGVAFPVRENLWDALFHLRESSDRCLWIDAICIDQANLAERSHQVQQMNQIYKQAWRVLIWLGLESEDSKEALDYIKSGSSISQPNVSVDLNQFLRKVEAVCRLCDRPYWRRLWIVQEVLLARDARIQCGRDYTSWDDFSNFRIQWDKRIGMGFARRHFGDVRKNLAFNLDRYQFRQTSFKDLLQAFQTSLCSDIRDKVYGLAGLATDGERLCIDYSKSVFEIFADVLSLQRKAESASLVAFARFLQRVLEIHPWDDIPDNSCLVAHTVEAAGRERGAIFELGPLLAQFNPPQQRLELVAPLESADNEPLWNIGNFLSLKATCRIRREAIAIHSPVSYGHRGVMAPASSYSIRSSPRSGSSTSRYSTSRTYPYIAPKPPQTKQTINERTAQEYSEATPRFFLDSRGNVGLVPSNVRVGDVLCSFDSCNIVAVLRWSRDRFLFVGRAVFVELRDSQVSFMVPLGELDDRRIGLHVNAHTLHLLAK